MRPIRRSIRRQQHSANDSGEWQRARSTIRMPRQQTATAAGYVDVWRGAAAGNAVADERVPSTLEGATPTAANNGTARLADIDVITANSFERAARHDARDAADPDNPGQCRPRFRRRRRRGLHPHRRRHEPQQPAGHRRHQPGDVSYGFEEFTGTNTPGFTNGGVGALRAADRRHAARRGAALRHRPRVPPSRRAARRCSPISSGRSTSTACRPRLRS